MHIHSNAIILIAILGMILSVSGAYGQTPARADDPGARLFFQTCRVCHGAAGIGGVGPALRGAKFTAEHVRARMSESRPGSMMPQFSKTFTPTELSQVANYVASLQQQRLLPSPNHPRPGALVGNAVAGESVFFARDRTHSCFVCHSYQGRGGRVGPDLATKVANATARDIFQKIIVVPHRSTDPAYATTRLRTRGGLLITGITAGETKDAVRFYDTSSLPPTLRTIPKSEIVEADKPQTSVMPNDYAARLTLQQLLDVVAFLKSTGNGASAPVTLNDVIE
jgi:putative heme-binding domain-containing protein